MPLSTEEYETALEVGDRVKIINTENVWRDKQGLIIDKIADNIYTVGVIFAPGKIVHQDFEKEYLEPLNGGRVEMAEDYKTEYKYTKKLPTRVSISMYDLEYNPEADSEDYLTELINNYLSDNYGYLVSGYNYDVKRDRVIVSNISWDLEESYYDNYKTEDKEMRGKLDWDRLYITTLSYNDLDLEVEDTFVEFTNTNDPLSDYGDTGEEEYTRRGVINYWDYYIDLTLDDIARYLNKDKEKITQRDIDNIDEEDFYDFLLDYYRRDAEEDAAEKHEVDDVYYYTTDDWRDDYERD